MFLGCCNYKIILLFAVHLCIVYTDNMRAPFHTNCVRSTFFHIIEALEWINWIKEKTNRQWSKHLNIPEVKYKTTTRNVFNAFVLILYLFLQKTVTISKSLRRKGKETVIVFRFKWWMSCCGKRFQPCNFKFCSVIHKWTAAIILSPSIYLNAHTLNASQPISGRSTTFHNITKHGTLPEAQRVLGRHCCRNLLAIVISGARYVLPPHSFNNSYAM